MKKIKSLILSALLSFSFTHLHPMDPSPRDSPALSPSPPPGNAPVLSPGSPPSGSPLLPLVANQPRRAGFSSHHPTVRTSANAEKELTRNEFARAVHQKRSLPFLNGLETHKKRMLAQDHIKVQDKHGCPVHIPSLPYALSAKAFGATDILLDFDADPSQTYRGANALHLAIENNAPPKLLERLASNPKLHTPYPLDNDCEVPLLGYAAQHTDSERFKKLYAHQPTNDQTSDIAAFALSLNNKQGREQGKKIREFLALQHTEFSLFAPALRYLMHTQPSIFSLFRKPLIDAVYRTKQHQEGACEELLHNALIYQDFASFVKIHDTMDSKITKEMADALLLKAASNGDSPNNNKFITHLLEVMGAGEDLDRLERIAQTTHYPLLQKIAKERRDLKIFQDFKKGAPEREAARKKRYQETQP